MASQILGNDNSSNNLASRYEVQQQLGKKAGRQTLLARDLLTGELVVVKLLSFSSEFEWDDLKLFEREAKTLQALSHPAIPSYIDYFELNSPQIKGFALVQTYIAAPTLEEHLKSGRIFTEAEVKQIATSLLEILIYLHSHQPPVLHRDIKPSNILLANRSGNSVGEVYLVDFGSVQTVVAKEGGTMTVVGTYGYMPQEQFGDRTVPASDLYSLAATLIYLVTGTHPADLPHKNGRIQFEQIAALSPLFTSWLRQMSAPNLDERFHNASEALGALEQTQQLDQNSPLATCNWEWNGNTWIPQSQKLTQHSALPNQPAGSKIKLKSDENTLEILIPPVGWQSSLVLTGWFAIVWNAFILFWTIGAVAVPFPTKIPLALFSIPFWGAGFVLLYKVFFTLYGRIRLRLNWGQISLTKELWGFKVHHPRPAPREHINKLIYIPPKSTTDSDGGRVEMPPQIIIWAGVHKYHLGGANGAIKSEPEVEWLAHELSNWLGIPITRE